MGQILGTISERVSIDAKIACWGAQFSSWILPNQDNRYRLRKNQQPDDVLNGYWRESFRECSVSTSGANVVSNNIQGPRSFTGNTDSVQPFSVNQGGYIFTVPMMVLTISSYGLPTHRGTKSPYYSIPSVPIRAVKLSIFRQDNITWIFRQQVPIQLIWLRRETARTYLFRFCQVVGR